MRPMHTKLTCIFLFSRSENITDNGFVIELYSCRYKMFKIAILKVEQSQLKLDRVSRCDFLIHKK